MPATKKKAAPAVKADSAVGKATLKPVKVAKVPVVQATSKGKGMQRFKYTGKKASERVKTAGQFIGLTQALEENMGIEHKDFDRSSFTIAELMDYAVLEGHVEMRRDEDRDPVLYCCKNMGGHAPHLFLEGNIWMCKHSEEN